MDSRVEIQPVKYYIGFKIDNKRIFGVSGHPDYIRLSLYRVEPKDLNDPEKEVWYEKNSFKYYNQHISNIDIKTDKDINYAVMLVKQLLKKVVD